MTETVLSSNVNSTNDRSLHGGVGAVRFGVACLEMISTAAAERIAGYLFAKPKRCAIDPGALATMATAHRFDLEAADRTLAAWSWGDGPTIVLHHGWSGRASHMAAFVKPLTDAGFSVVAYDAPAHGDSPGTTTSLPEIARVLRDVARRLHGIHGVVGHSFGSAVTLLAIRYGLRIDRAVVIAPPSDMNDFVDQFAETIGLGPRARSGMEQRWVERYRFSWEDMDVRGWARGRMPPLLVFHDRDDAVVPWRHGDEVARAWPNAKLVTTTGLGHRRIRENPDVVREAVRFLESSVRRDVGPPDVPGAAQSIDRPERPLTSRGGAAR